MMTTFLAGVGLMLTPTGQTGRAPMRDAIVAHVRALLDDIQRKR